MVIADEKNYRENIRQYFFYIINGRLMSLLPFEMSNQEVVSAVTEYDKTAIKCDRFCTWLTIGDICTDNYQGRDFKLLHLKANGVNALQINFSQFKYKMSPLEGNNATFSPFVPENARYVCTVDGQSVIPERFFSEKKGERLLLIYSFPAATAFQQQKECYFFAYNNVSIDNIRCHILHAQREFLRLIIKHPALTAPGTTIISYVGESENSRPVITNNCITDATIAFTEKVFKEEFIEMFEDKLKHVEESIAQHISDEER